MQVVKKYGIAAKIGWHTSDNATSCLLAMRHCYLRATASSLKQVNEMRRASSTSRFKPFSSRRQRKPLKPLLIRHPRSGEDLTQFSTTLAAGSGRHWARCNACKEAVRGSRDSKFSGIGGLPCLQKLHSLAVWLRSSSLHMGDWDAAVGMRLGIDATRWSSWFQVIDRALAKRSEIKLFLVIMKMSLETAPLQCQWELLEKAHQFL